MLLQVCLPWDLALPFCCVCEPLKSQHLQHLKLNIQELDESKKQMLAYLDGFYWCKASVSDAAQKGVLTFK